MQLTASSTPEEVIMYHPLREHYDDIILNPKKTWFGHAGPWTYVLPAQDSVILRRHIRKHFPDVAAIFRINEFSYDQLVCLIENQRTRSPT